MWQCILEWIYFLPLAWRERSIPSLISFLALLESFEKLFWVIDVKTSSSLQDFNFFSGILLCFTRKPWQGQFEIYISVFLVQHRISSLFMNFFLWSFWKQLICYFECMLSVPLVWHRTLTCFVHWLFVFLENFDKAIFSVQWFCFLFKVSCLLSRYILFLVSWKTIKF